jgi:hypothetical protein
MIMALRGAVSRHTSAEAQEFAAVLAVHFQAYQAFALQDVYKLIYQRVFGPEHGISNVAAARERLYLEILQVPQTPSSMPLLDPLSPTLCRVNLQPFMQRGSSVALLWKAFRRTAREFQPGTVQDVQRTWRWFVATPWAQRYAPALLEQFWQSMATANFTPVHHSRDYVMANAPHYRVVSRALLHEHLGLGTA